MKFFPLLWSNLKRKKIRTAFTLLSIVVSFILFGYLGAVRVAFSAYVQVAGVDRLITTHKTSIIMNLPASYQAKMADIPGVALVTHASWFGGIYQNSNTGFQGVFQAPVDPESYLKMFPEFVVPEEQKKKWMGDREGVLVGRTTAERYHWKVGDRVPIQATIWRKKDGTATWEFNVDGIYGGAKKATDLTQFLFHYDYFDEARGYGKGSVGWYYLRISDPARSAEIAKQVDELFANSSAETKTATEKAFAKSFADQVGSVGTIIQGILAAVFFTLLLVAGNTMAQAVRERTSELAVLKTVGFTNGGVLLLVLAEAMLLAIVGGGLGLAIAWTLISFGDPTGGYLPIFFLPPTDLVVGIGFVFLLGLVTGFLPAMQAMRLRIVDALRRA